MYFNEIFRNIWRRLAGDTPTIDPPKIKGDDQRNLITAFHLLEVMEMLSQFAGNRATCCFCRFKKIKILYPACSATFGPRACVNEWARWSSRIGCGPALKMATSLGSNTYNRQNWEDAVRFITPICAVRVAETVLRADLSCNTEIWRTLNLFNVTLHQVWIACKLVSFPLATASWSVVVRTRRFISVLLKKIVTV